MQGLLEVLGERGLEAERFARLGVLEREVGGVEEVPREPFERGAAIEQIAHERMTGGCEVRANLMTACDRSVDEQACVGTDRLGQEHVGDRVARVQAHGVALVDAREDLARVLRVRRERIGERRGCAESALDQRNVALADGAFVQRIAQSLKRVLVARREQQPGRLRVDAVHEARLSPTVTDAGHLGEPRDQSVGDRAELIGTQRMARHARILVNDDELRVLVDEAKLERGIRQRVEVGRLRELGERHDVTLREHRALTRTMPVDAHHAAFGEPTRLCAAHVRCSPHEHDVESRARVFCSDRERRRVVCHRRRVARTVEERQRRGPLARRARALMLRLPMAAQRDYYEVLGVPRDTSAEELKRAYRKKAVELHPDHNPDDAGAEDRFKEASAAYAVLSDADKRRRYDRVGHAAFTSAGSGGGGANDGPIDFGAMSDLLEGLLGDVLRAGRPKKRTGEDVRLDVTVTFEEAALGAEKTLEVTRPASCVACGGTGAEPGSRVEPCAACNGRGEQRFQRGFFASTRPCEACRATGKRIEKPCAPCKGVGAVPKKEPLLVRVPPGVEDGSVRTVRGGGQPAVGGAGDLHVYVHVAPHPFFTREGADVLCSVPVSFPQAVLGAQLEVPTLEGKVKMKLPAGSPSDKMFRLRGKGIQVFGGIGKGDQLVKVIVEVPDPAQLSKNARRLIEELATELGEEPLPEQRGFLDKLKGLFE